MSKVLNMSSDNISEDLRKLSPYLYRFYKALHTDCRWGSVDDFNGFLKSASVYVDIDKLPNRLQEFDILLDLYDYFLKVHPIETEKFSLNAFYSMLVIFSFDGIYVTHLNNMLRKRKVKRLLK